MFFVDSACPMGIGYCLGYVNRLLLDLSIKGLGKLVKTKKDKIQDGDITSQSDKTDSHFASDQVNRAEGEQDFKPEENKITFNDIAGLDDVMQDLTEVVDFLKYSEKYTSMGASLPRGVLLKGPPGNGKTLIARALAHEAGCTFIQVNASDFVEKYVGVGASRVRELFEKARRNKPAIIFIDELDAIGAVNRGSDGNEEYKQTLNELLCQMDGFKQDDAIVVIAATNHAKSLDSALDRRFDRKIAITAPNEAAREKIMRLYLNKLPQDHCQISDTCAEKVAKLAYGLCGADLKTIVNEAVLAAIRDGMSKTTDEHVLKALEKVRRKNK